MHVWTFKSLIEIPLHATYRHLVVVILDHLSIETWSLCIVSLRISCLWTNYRPYLGYFVQTHHDI